MNPNRVYMPVTGLLIVLVTPLLVWLEWTKIPGSDFGRFGAVAVTKLLLLIAFLCVAAHLCEDSEDCVFWLTMSALLPGLLGLFVQLISGPAMARLWPIYEAVLLLYGLLMLLIATLKAESDAAGSSSEAPPSEQSKPQKKPERNREAERERDDLLKELKAAAADKDSPLDPVTVEAQRQEIEANYQRKLAQRSNA